MNFSHPFYRYTIISALILAGCSEPGKPRSYEDEFDRIATSQTPLSSMSVIVANHSVWDRPVAIQQPERKTLGECWAVAIEQSVVFSHGEVRCLVGNQLTALQWRDRVFTIHSRGYIIPQNGSIRRLTR